MLKQNNIPSIKVSSSASVAQNWYGVLSESMICDRIRIMQGFAFHRMSCCPLLLKTANKSETPWEINIKLVISTHNKISRCERWLNEFHYLCCGIICKLNVLTVDHNWKLIFRPNIARLHYDVASVFHTREYKRSVQFY